MADTEAETETQAEAPPDDGPAPVTLPPRDMVARLLEAHAASYEAARLLPPSIARVAFERAFAEVARSCGPFEAGGLRYDWNRAEASVTRESTARGRSVLPTTRPPVERVRGERGAAVRLYPRGAAGRNFH